MFSSCIDLFSIHRMHLSILHESTFQLSFMSTRKSDYTKHGMHTLLWIEQGYDILVYGR